LNLTSGMASSRDHSDAVDVVAALASS